MVFLLNTMKQQASKQASNQGSNQTEQRMEQGAAKGVGSHEVQVERLYRRAWTWNEERERQACCLILWQERIPCASISEKYELLLSEIFFGSRILSQYSFNFPIPLHHAILTADTAPHKSLMKQRATVARVWDRSSFGGICFFNDSESYSHQTKGFYVWSDFDKKCAMSS